MFRKNKCKVVKCIKTETRNLSESKNLLDKIKLFSKLLNLEDNEIKEYIDTIFFKENLVYNVYSRANFNNLGYENKDLHKKIIKNIKVSEKKISLNTKVLNSVFRIKKLFTKDTYKVNEYNKAIENPFTFMDEGKVDVFTRVLNHEFSFEEEKELSKKFKEDEARVKYFADEAIKFIYNNPNDDSIIEELVRNEEKFIGEDDHYYFFNTFIDSLCRTKKLYKDEIFKVINKIANQIINS